MLTQDGRIAKLLIGDETRGREGIPGARASTCSPARCPRHQLRAPAPRPGARRPAAEARRR
ncbi:MAG: hypothetical protein MZW92_59355 [Comamonadaceae bacterium]|nr:hypothetical protein [Comamonadaceae bacterium]